MKLLPPAWNGGKSDEKVNRMSILDYYNQKLADNAIEPDPIQQQTVQLLHQIGQQLEQQPPARTRSPKSQTGLLSRWFGAGKPEPVTNPSAIRGVYLWGGVGRGKTWLMDQFFKHVAIADKERIHFNRFMLDLHQELAKHAHLEDPLRLIAQEKARKIRLLCLDELHLTEITNAMLLYPMLENLIREGVTLVVTSNRHPDELYQGSFHAERFHETTRFLLEQLHVIHLDYGLDYRVRRTERVMGKETRILGRDKTTMLACFEQLARGPVREAHTLKINDREVRVKLSSDNVIWFDFAELCETQRTTSDYIWLTERYEVLMVCDIPVMDEGRDPAARRFFYLIDEVYDRKVRFIFSANDSVDQLYQGVRLKFAFKRTLSRLMAMHHANRLTC